MRSSSPAAGRSRHQHPPLAYLISTPSPHCITSGPKHPESSPTTTITSNMQTHGRIMIPSHLRIPTSLHATGTSSLPRTIITRRLWTPSSPPTTGTSHLQPQYCTIMSSWPQNLESPPITTGTSYVRRHHWHINTSHLRIPAWPHATDPSKRDVPPTPHRDDQPVVVTDITTYWQISSATPLPWRDPHQTEQPEIARYHRHIVSAISLPRRRHQLAADRCSTKYKRHIGSLAPPPHSHHNPSADPCLTKFHRYILSLSPPRRTALTNRPPIPTSPSSTATSHLQPTAVPSSDLTMYHGMATHHRTLYLISHYWASSPDICGSRIITYHWHIQSWPDITTFHWHISFWSHLRTIITRSLRMPESRNTIGTSHRRPHCGAITNNASTNSPWQLLLPECGCSRK